MSIVCGPEVGESGGLNSDHPECYGGYARSHISVDKCSDPEVTDLISALIGRSPSHGPIQQQESQEVSPYYVSS